MKHRPLHDGWTLRAASGDSGITGVPATVPGCVHTDLMAAGLIDDPYLDANETRLTWIGRTDWAYETSFHWEPDDPDARVDLVCEGLDTVATVMLNGRELGTTANMHRSYRFPVRDLLVEGANSLCVLFGSPYEYAERRRAELGDRPGAYAEPYQFIRKMACNFGWDWGPTLVTSGIWRPIGLETWSVARLACVRPLVEVVRDGDRIDGKITVHAQIERQSDEPLDIRVSLGDLAKVVGALPEGRATAEVRVDVPAPELWWPRGYGEQPLYDLTVELVDASGRVLDTWRREVGFRSVRLDTDGGAFTIVVNDRPVFVKGVNWIPDDCFPTRVTPKRLAERIDQACRAGVNTLRVWGGGRYECEEFYRLADEKGLLVWQDFPFACAAYPEEGPFREEVEAEARQNVVALAHHPSLVLWCGNNENIEGFHDWGWRERLAGKSWGAGFYYDLLPSVVAELDPTRPYWPGTPYSGAPDLPPNDPARGTIHIWDVWNTRDYTHYASYRPRFVAEFGFQGPPTYATLRRAVSDDPLTPTSPGVLHHQKADDGHGKLMRGLEGHFRTPRTFDDWHYLTQLNQARAIAFGVEHLRALAPHCMGAIVWQLNDCWPVTSWSAVDGDGRRKPLWYALRRAYADRLLVVRPTSVTVVNDTAEPWTGRLTVTRINVAGEPLAEETFEVTAEPRGVAAVELPGPLATPSYPMLELLVAELDGVRALRPFAEDRDMAYPEARMEAHAESATGGAVVTVTAQTLVRDLAIFPDRLDPAASVDDMLVTLLPGETARFRVTSPGGLDTAALTTYPVLRCVNETPRRPTDP
ncbi:glycosyl hydrolase 2 galactose-binding domain-containing protein [Thermostaphylospora chromogena]|uniref:Beta-mannosidase B n=1 Tax=Thermostaphylospora chromogena TaxID=35622 RepID=A0A1H1HK96_9ACTN|nr:glycoside hydrolase family 2 protein [Thermostaphylospora chromogena]SDR25831.1 beta-mannosidase [Thermostaphylospora chromogena]